ncbi:LysR family transcriptional regulator [Rhizobium deserti]|uniref:HTH-type transcriptional regulator TtuA n=1 Tax=Rhizobium deserti TaxID=2547961 RepID=A0A4R5U5S6_9HYPH|nr:LysR family transcriptional regulator [Rhizobium deserti]TDK29357.1 LysR family transcriptional regulator [Rhizobium deserti]
MKHDDRLLSKLVGLEEFLRVAETLSFVRAAETLGQAPSAISKSVRRLEERLGIRLLHRTTRNVSLTDEGAELYGHAKKWLAELDDMQAKVGRELGELKGIVRIDMPTSLGRSQFMTHLAVFMERHPKLTVELRMHDQYVNLIAEGVDMAIRVGHLRDSEMIARPLGQIRLGTYLSPRYIERTGMPGRIEDLKDHRLLAFVSGNGRTRAMTYRAARREITIDPRQAVATFTNGEAMIDAAVAGIGIAQTPAIYARQALSDGSLIQIFDGQDAGSLPIQIVYPSQRQMPRRVRAMIDYLVGTMKEASD